MAEYAYEALNPSGTVVRGTMNAATERELEERLRADGSYLIRAKPQEAEREARTKRTDGRIERKYLLAFTEYLAGSMLAGIPIMDTLRDVEAQLESKRLRKIVGEVRASMSRDGKALSEALAEHPKAFSPLYRGTIAAGEASGHLDFVLQQLVDSLDWQEEIATQVRQATRYPAIVVSAMVLLVLGLVAFVYPRLVPLLTGFEVELPLPTRILLSAGTFLREEWVGILAGTAGVAAVLWLVQRTEHGRLVRDRIVLRLPLFGRLILQVNMARFVTYLGLFYRTGVELIRGLELVEQMMGNQVVARIIRRARQDIVAGENMATAFSRSRRVPIIVRRSIALGEATGSLDEALRRTKAYYDRQIPAEVNRLTTALQPMLVVGLGVVLAVIALSIFLPILSIYNSIGVG